MGELRSIVSVVRDFQFFVCEKWEIASDRSGSGNTANIGSITRIEDILSGNGMFKQLGEKWFDEVLDKLWQNHAARDRQEITKLADYLAYRGQDSKLVNPRAKTTRGKA